MLKGLILFMLAILAFFGGMSLTKKLRVQQYMRKAKKIVSDCEPCTCGSDIISLLIDEEGNNIRIECEKCGRIVSGENVVERWNRGERDGKE